MNVLKPSPSGPSRWSEGILASSKTRLAQSEPRMPSFSSPFSTRKPRVVRGTTNALMPLTPIPGCVTAVTMNVPAWFAFVQKHLAPFSTHCSPRFTAVVRVAPASEPAPGSVRPYAPMYSPATRRGTYSRRRRSFPHL